MGLPKEIAISNTMISSTSPFPDLKRNFQYGTLQDGEIRIVLLKPGSGESLIECELKTITIKSLEVELYHAVSYTWDVENRNQRAILLNGTPFLIQENLYDFLIHFRLEKKASPLWIDAICINQDEAIDEKKTQIPLMGLIYSKASTVQIWLGPARDDSDMIMRAFAGDRSQLGDAVRVKQAIIALYKRAWFTRVWVVQELILAAPEAAFLNCGHVRVPWDQFATCVRSIFELDEDDPWEGPDGPNFKSRLQRRAQKVRSYLGLSLYRSRPPDNSSSLVSIEDRLESAIPNLHQTDARTITSELLDRGEFLVKLSGLRATYAGMKSKSNSKGGKFVAAMLGDIIQGCCSTMATYRKDKIYALLGIFEQSVTDAFMSVYHCSLEEILLTTTRFILTEGAQNLYHSYPTLPLQVCRQKGVPSWTLDFSYNPSVFAWRTIASDLTEEGYDVGAKFTECGKQMIVNACVIDRVTKIVPYSLKLTRVPETETQWLTFWRIYQTAASTEGMAIYHKYDAAERVRMVEYLVKTINYIQFIMNIQDLFVEAQLYWPIKDQYPNLMEFLWDGLGIIGSQNGARVEEPLIDILLGDLDEDLPDKWLPFWQAATTALGVDAKFAMAPARCDYCTYMVELMRLVMKLDSQGQVFITEYGILGLSMEEVEVGDHVARIFKTDDYDMPVILRCEEGNKYSFITVATTSNDWKGVLQAQGRMRPEEIILI